MSTHHVAAAACLIFGLGCASSHPVTSDPKLRDAEFPAAQVSMPIESHGSTMNGVLYVPAGPGPHPSVILLHGFPGDERNLDLAHALRRSGFAVLFFHYRGAWGSEGSYTLANMLEDVGAAVTLAGTSEFAQAGRSDPKRISLVGHSMGGFAALMVGSDRSDVACVVSIAGANLGRMVPPDAETQAVAARRFAGLTRPLAGATGESIVAEIVEQADRFETTQYAPSLATKPVLLVTGSHDTVVPRATHHDPLADAIEQAGATALTERSFPADHAFSSRRVQLSVTVADWLNAQCR